MSTIGPVPTSFSRVLVANRGEIAVRVMATLRRMGIESVAVYSDVDAGALHVRRAERAVRLGPAPAAQSYLDIDRVIEAARLMRVDAIHPGYGFLSENADFAQACLQAGMVFIGPSPEVLESMGDKIRAKAIAASVGVPLVPGRHDPGMDDAALAAACADTGFPVILKPSAGGGGKGMRVVRSASEVSEAIAGARREARGAFGDDTLLVERYVPSPRHIEVQVFGDHHGTIVHLGERECSLQRRHQKVIEEAPSPALDPVTRAAICSAAVRIAEKVGYVGAGTVEFVVPTSDPGDFAFLEMNTRLQVEHPVTEMVTGIDLVEWQVRIAAGEPIPRSQESIQVSGHAVEARLYAEDPRRGFVPTGGDVLIFEPAEDVRVDCGIESGVAVASTYDPMLAKVIAHGPDRRAAWARLDSALARTVLLGVDTNIDYLRWLIRQPGVRQGQIDTGLIERLGVPAGDEDGQVTMAIAALVAEIASPASLPGFGATDGWRLGGRADRCWEITVDGRRHDVRWNPEGSLDVDGVIHRLAVLGSGIAASTRCTEEIDGVAHGVHVELDGVAFRAHVAHDPRGTAAWVHAEGIGTWEVTVASVLHRRMRRGRDGAEGDRGSWIGRSPMPGLVAMVGITVGQAVSAGDALVVIEAMKMEHVVRAPGAGTVSAVRVAPGAQVVREEELVVVELAGSAG